jgi:hypothetical protein
MSAQMEVAYEASTDHGVHHRTWRHLVCGVLHVLPVVKAPTLRPPLPSPQPGLFFEADQVRLI